jgi:hypothetical protein
MAAVDLHGRFASNNFFVVMPRPGPGPGHAHPLDLDGLAALLNSDFMTWYFQAIEPRKGRAFAEIKIKHIIELPLPAAGREAACQRLNQLGAEQRELVAHAPQGRRGPAATRLDRDTENAVLGALELPLAALHAVGAHAVGQEPGVPLLAHPGGSKTRAPGGREPLRPSRRS